MTTLFSQFPILIFVMYLTYWMQEINWNKTIIKHSLAFQKYIQLDASLPVKIVNQ